MNPEGENMISSAALHISPRRIKEHADKVTTNPFMIWMTFSKTLASLVRTDMPGSTELSMNTPGPTADLRDPLRPVLNPTFLMTVRILRECLLLMTTPKRLKTGFMGHQNSNAEQWRSAEEIWWPHTLTVLCLNSSVYITLAQNCLKWIKLMVGQKLYNHWGGQRWVFMLYILKC